MPLMNEQIVDDHSSALYYDACYKRHYMETWPVWKQQRIHALIASLQLPDHGVALDYGCGQGIFTQVMKDALPAWEILGVDISNEAVEMARTRYPACTFVRFDDISAYEGSIDFLFSHHVLEHIVNLDETIGMMRRLCSSHAWMLHVCPCGNEGSYEHMLVSLVRNGIQHDNNNRFFYEDPGHVRRLTSTALSEIMSQHGFLERESWFASHYHEAIMWMTDSSLDMIKEIIDPERAVDASARRKLVQERRRVMRLAVKKRPGNILRAIHLFGVVDRFLLLQRIRHHSARLVDFIAQQLTASSIAETAELAAKEWAAESKSKNGSEMYMLYAAADAERCATGMAVTE